MTLALSLVTGVADAAGKGAPLEAEASVDLDAIDSRIHAGRCICMACSGAARFPQGRSGSTVTGGSTGGTSAMPAASLQTLANYLTRDFWLEAGTYARRFNLTSSGTGAKNGVITYNVTGWADDGNGLSADRRALTREVFKLYSAVTGINFREVTGSGGDIRFTDNDSGAYAYMASGWYADSTRKVVIIDYSVVNVQASWDGGRSNYNTYTPQTIFHEIGHALGLGHQGQYNYTGTPLSYATSAQFANDSWQVTMMSYWDQAENTTTGASFAWLQTPMAVDWIALNDLYGGQGYSTDNAFLGDTVYGVGTNISASVSQIWNLFSTYAGVTAYTLVDGGGHDILDVSNFGANQLINLAPSRLDASVPSVSSIGGKIGNLTIAEGTIIEAANGGSGNDSFYGNDAANTFRGNGGDDSFYDSLGSDIYYGDAGNDWLYFSVSIDLFRYELLGDSLLFSRIAGSLDVDQVWNSVEYLVFDSVSFSYTDIVNSLLGPVLADVTISSVNGLTSGSLTNTTTLSFQGSLSQPLDAGQTITFYRDGIELGTAEPSLADPTSWSFSFQEAAGTNAFSYTARVVDTASGRIGDLSSPFSLSIDTDPPLVTVNPLATESTTPLLSGSISEAAAAVSVSIGGLSRSAMNNGNGTWSLQWSDALSPGATYDVVVTATDAAGNTGSDSSADELSILISLADVTISSVNGLTSGSLTNTTTLSFQGSLSQPLDAGQTITFYRDGIELGTAEPSLADPTSWSFSFQEAAGTNAFSYTARVVDTASGRIGDLSSPFSLNIDTDPPLVTVNPLATESTTPLLSGSISEAAAAVSVSIGGLSRSAMNNGNGTWSLQWSDALSPGATYDVVVTATDAAGNTGSDSSADELSILPPTPPVLLFSLASSITTASASVMGGLTARANDIIGFDGSNFSVWLNGNASGMAGAALRDFHILSDDELVVAFQKPVNLGGIAFDDSDLARLNRNASGGFDVSMLFDGSDVGLTTNGEAVDAVTGLPDGSWLISTRGSGSVPGVSSFKAQDILRFTPTSLGQNTRGSWRLYADMSDVGISSSAENITAMSAASDGRLFLTTRGNASSNGLSAANEDVFAFRPTRLGNTTSGSFQQPLHFDGSLYGLGPNALTGIQVPL
ncbi:M10 family metallopeptidase C-terminal domain-containing protein [Microcystis elabens FACHB-917]|nr:M10 family metallopeptidase C-terminal domain-containing protein [Microcystis elabens FACHB-917]